MSGRSVAMLAFASSHHCFCLPFSVNPLTHDHDRRHVSRRCSAWEMVLRPDLRGEDRLGEGVGGNGLAVLPDPALDVSDASKGDPIESGDILLVDGPTECSGVLLGLVPVLGPGYRNHTLCHDPVQGDLTRHLPPVLFTDAPELGDNSVDDLHGMFGEIAFAEGRMRRRVLAGESTLADR
jgi:hypothetical protein